MIGCDCAVCRSTDPRDTRSRPSIVVEHDDGLRVLVDTTPDLRSQALRARLAARRRDPVHARARRPPDGARRSAPLQRADQSGRCRSSAMPPRFAKCGARSRTCSRPTRPRAAACRTSVCFRSPAAVLPRPAGRAAGADSPRPVARSWDFASADLPISPTATAFPTRRWRCCTGSTASCSTRCGGGRIRRTSRSTKRCTMARRIGARHTLFTHIAHDLAHAETCAALARRHGARARRAARRDAVMDVRYVSGLAAARLAAPDRGARQLRRPASRPSGADRAGAAGAPRRRGGTPVAVIFDPHPPQVLRPDKAPPLLDDARSETRRASSRPASAASRSCASRTSCRAGSPSVRRDAC